METEVEDKTTTSVRETRVMFDQAEGVPKKKVTKVEIQPRVPAGVPLAPKVQPKPKPVPEVIPKKVVQPVKKPVPPPAHEKVKSPSPRLISFEYFVSISKLFRCFIHVGAVLHQATKMLTDQKNDCLQIVMILNVGSMYLIYTKIR